MAARDPSPQSDGELHPEPRVAPGSVAPLSAGAGPAAADSGETDARTAEALALLDQGRLEEAEAIYRELIAAGSEDPLVLGNLGAICGMTGRLDELIGWLRQALDRQPAYPEAQLNLAMALEQQGRLAEAIASYERVVQLRPHDAEAWNHLGRAQLRHGEAGDALTSLGRALSLKPDWPEAVRRLDRALEAAIDAGDTPPAPPAAVVAAGSEAPASQQPQAWNEFGIALRRQGNLPAAIAAYRKALNLDPGQAATHFNLGNALKDRGDQEEAIAAYRLAVQAHPDHFRAWNNLGTILHERGDHAGAVEAYEAALRIQPAYPTGLSNLGNTLNRMGEREPALTAFNRALALQPDYPAAHNNLGTLWQEEGDLAAATAAYGRALELRPDYPEAHYNLGTVRHEQGALEEALACYRRALELRPAYPNAELSLAMVLLMRGEYAQGWRHYERRFQADSGRGVLHAVPRCRLWEGNPLQAGEPLLAVCEQGLGDALQFMRYVFHLRRRGVQASICAPESLHGLIRASGIDPAPLSQEQAGVVERGQWIPLLSLPRHLGVSPTNPVLSEPYLHAGQPLLDRWRERLAAERRPILAINWQGNPEHERSIARGRSLTLEAFAPIAGLGGLRLLSLQKGPGSEQLATCSFRQSFVRCQDQVDAAWDFEETAAIIANCDLVITSDTAIAHLAGGMGRPTWLLLKHTPEWRWGQTGESTFWYPSMRLFRQRSAGDWPELIERLAAALRERFAIGMAAGGEDRNDTSRTRSGAGASGLGPANAREILAPVSLGELIDKITILRIKQQHLQGQALHHVDRELGALEGRLHASGIVIRPELVEELERINRRLWRIEDEIRDQERQRDFGDRFIELARSVYRTNDRRAAIKKEINLSHGSSLVEEKSYRSY